MKNYVKSFNNQDSDSSNIEREILPFESHGVPEFFQKKAEVELHDLPERRTQGLRLIREKAKNEKTMKDVDFSDEFLMQYLRSRKYNVPKAFSQLKSFVNLRRNHPLMFTDFKFENTIKTITNQFVTVLPWRCQDGCAIILVQLDNWDPEDFPLEEVKRMAIVLLLQSLRDPMTQINGFKVIFDVESNPLRILRHVTPQNLYLLVHGPLECVAGRYKAVHIVNDSITFKAAWLIVKHFLPDKLKKRIFFHSTSETLLNHLPRSVLPVKYGGDLEDYDMSHWLRKVMQPEELEAMVGGK